MSDEAIVIELNPRERRLYDRLRARVASYGPETSSGWRDLLLLLPDLSVLMLRLLRDPRVPIPDKALALLGVGYLLSPLDLIPDLLLGPIGWIDDLLIVSATLSRLVNHVHADIVRSHWSGKGDALGAIQRVTHWSETLFTHRLRGLVRGRFRLEPR